MTDTCGHPTADGSPCENPATDDGSCWLNAHGGDAEPSGRPRNPPDRSTQEQIAEVVERGGSLREACRRAGCHREQLKRWMDYGEEEEAGPFQEFRDRLVRARGEGEAKYRTTLMKLAEEAGDTATLMAMLKQRYPDSWGDVDRGEQADGAVEVTSEVVTVEAADE